MGAPWFSRGILIFRKVEDAKLKALIDDLPEMKSMKWIAKTFPLYMTVGIIVWTWQNEQDDTDVYIAFFGNEFPESKYVGSTSPKKPSILRYYESNLERID